MRANNNRLPTNNTRHGHNDTRLRPGRMAHKTSRRQRVPALGDGLLDALKQPLGGGDAVLRVEVPVVELGVLGELGLDPAGVDPVDDLLDGALVVRAVGEGEGGEEAGRGGLDFLELGDVEEVLALLYGGTFV